MPSFLSSFKQLNSDIKGIQLTVEKKFLFGFKLVPVGLLVRITVC